MYLLWRALRFLTIIGCLIYTLTSLTPHIFDLGNRFGLNLQPDSQRQAHAAALAMLHKLSPNTYRAPVPTELLGSADQPANLQEYYKDAH